MKFEMDKAFQEKASSWCKKYARPNWREHIQSFDQSRAKDTLLDVKHVFDEGKLRFWLVYGTALGAYRDKRFIPWDKDIDIAILYEDRYKFLVLIDSLLKIGIEPWIMGVKADEQSGIWFRFGRGKCFIDIILLFEMPDAYHCLQFSMKKEWLRVTEKSKIEFLGETFLIPSPPEEYFESKYGKDWRTPKQNVHALT